MAHTIYYLDPSYWTVSGGSLITNGLVGLDTQAYIFNPSVIQANGFNPGKTNMTRAQFNVYFGTLTSGQTSIPNAADFTVSNWSSKGWGSTPTSILNFYYQFISNNFLTGTFRRDINAMDKDLQTLLVSGTIGGTAYFLPIAIYGAQGISVPSAPVGLNGTAGNAQVSLSWGSPASTGGSPIQFYIVQSSTNGGLSWNTVGSYPTTSAIVTSGIVNGTSYIFRVAAVNAVSVGSFSANSPSITPAALYPMVISISKITGQFRVNIVSDTEPSSTAKRWALANSSGVLISTDNRFGIYSVQSNGSYRIRAYTSDPNSSTGMYSPANNEKVRWLSEEVLFTLP